MIVTFYDRFADIRQIDYLWIGTIYEKVVYETDNNRFGGPSDLAATAVVVGLGIGETADPLPECSL
ncbi:MAG: hypothetical protein KFF68_15990 [Desulfosarcina sp.]|nr:hypothetical protein [Desulfosarcina sp.]